MALWAVPRAPFNIDGVHSIMNGKKISILTGCYNEEFGIAECHQQVRELFENWLTNYDYEHVFIDNCSEDGTVDVLKAIASKDRRVKIIVNSRNFGAVRSRFQGVLETCGDAVIPVLVDLQTPPDIIPDLVAKWEQGWLMVVAGLTGAEEGWFIRQCRKDVQAPPARDRTGTNQVR